MVATNLLASIGRGIIDFPREMAKAVHMKPVQAYIWFACWACWTLASMQFYALPFLLNQLSIALDVSETAISEANTTSMLSRSIGAVIFGVLADQFGRKWPLVVDLVCLFAFSLSSGFINTKAQLIGVRCLFGIAYGGTYGLIMATVLEAVPKRARGIVAGFTQQGFASGYLLASALHLAMYPYGWRPLYWLVAGLTLPVGVVWIIAPRYNVQERNVEVQAEEHGETPHEKLPLLKKLGFVAKRHPLAFLYALALTSGFNCLGHGTMDLYPTFLITQRGLSVKQETWVTCILQIGGITGGIIGGYLSHKVSPKYCAGTFVLLVIPWFPLWALSKSWGHLATGAFFVQFFNGAAVGNLGNLLQQLCPHPGMRAVFTGLAYNLGNAVSSCVPTIETALGEKYSLPDGTPNFAVTQMAVVGVVVGLLAIVLFSMPLSRLNQEWDREDPNTEIPFEHVNAKDIETTKESAGLGETSTKHIEQMSINLDGKP